VPDALALLVMFCCGGLLGLQARINGELGARVDSPLVAAAVSFVGGTVLLAVLVASRPQHRTAVRRAVAAPTRWWWWLWGGLGGAAVVWATADGVPQIGVALVSVCVVAGMASGALGVDALGLGPGGPRRLTLMRGVGSALAVGAVAVGAIGDRHADVRPLVFVALFAAGVAAALQQAANGRLREAADNAWVAGLVSFAVGAVVLVVVAAAFGAASGHAWPGTWWLYTGGPEGVVFIVAAAALVRRIGVLAVSLATIAGQLAAAVVLDAAWPEPGTSLRAATVISTVLTVVAVAVAALRPRRSLRDHGVVEAITP
jgi:transporter family-2 protein